MISFSPLLLLAPVGVFLLIFIFLFLVNVTHIFRTGTTTLTSLIFTIGFVFYSLTVLGFTANSLSSFDWNKPVTLGFGVKDFTDPGF